MLIRSQGLREDDMVIASSSLPFLKKMSYLMVSRQLKKGPKVRRHSPSRHRNRAYALTEFDNLDARFFRQMFRMDRATFDYLLSLVSPLIERDIQYSINRSGSPITPKTRLAVSLRWLASFWDADKKMGNILA